MASVLVVIDWVGAELSPAAKRVLGEGRRIATHMGATLYGLAALEDGSNSDRWIAELGLGGADKVVLLTGPQCTATALWPTHGPGITAVAEELAPSLVLFANSAAGRELAPRLAAHFRGVLVHDATIELQDEGRLLVHEWDTSRSKRRTVYASETAYSVFATLSPAGLKVARGEDDADVIFFDAPDAAAEASLAALRTELEARAISPLATAEIVVTAGAGARSFLPLVDALADALGATRAATHSLHSLGDSAPVVDVETGERTAPRLYIACGASGSDRHLGAIGSGTIIVAIDEDPQTPMFRAADYGLLGPLDELLPSLVEAVRNRPRGAL